MFATMPFHLTQNTNCKTLDVDFWKHCTSYGLRAASRHAHASFQEIEFNYEANEGTTPKENIAFENTFNVIQYPWYDGHDP